MRLRDALLAFGVYLGLQFILALVAGIYVAASGNFASPEAMEAAFLSPGLTLLLVTVSGVAALAGVALVAAVSGLGLASFGLRPTSRRWLLAGLGAFALGILVNLVVIGLYVWVTGDEADPQAALMGVATRGSALQFTLMLLMGGIVVPVGEELLFRGLLYAWLRRWGLWIAVGASSVVFGIFHGPSIVFFTATVLGIILALLYEWSGSLWPPIIAHAANNVFSFVAERLLQ